MNNSIFSNPKGWAVKAVGSSARYRLMQSFTLLLGAVLAAMLYSIYRMTPLPLSGYFVVLLFLVIAAVQFPLCYLRALRFYVAQHEQSNHETS